MWQNGINYTTAAVDALTRLSSISLSVQYSYSPLFFFLLTSHVCNCAHLFFFFLISSCHKSVLPKFLALSSDLLYHFLSFFLFLSFFTSDPCQNFRSENQISLMSYGWTGLRFERFSGQTSVQAVLSYFLYTRFLCIKNRFDERFTVNPVGPYGPVRI